MPDMIAPACPRCRRTRRASLLAKTLGALLAVLLGACALLLVIESALDLATMFRPYTRLLPPDPFHPDGAHAFPSIDPFDIARALLRFGFAPIGMFVFTAVVTFFWSRDLARWLARNVGTVSRAPAPDAATYRDTATHFICSSHGPLA